MRSILWKAFPHTADFSLPESFHPSQLYVGFPEATVDRPVRTLAAFAKIALEPGETQDARLEVNKEELGWYNEKTNSFVQDSAYKAFISTNERDVPAKGIRF